MHVACRVNGAHDFAHEYMSTGSTTCRGQLEVQVPGASRFRDSVLDLSSEIAEAKEGAGLASDVRNHAVQLHQH